MRLNDKRTGYEEIAEWDELDDEEASELDYTPAPVQKAAPINPEPQSGPPAQRREADFGGNFDDVL